MNKTKKYIWLGAALSALVNDAKGTKKTKIGEGKAHLLVSFWEDQDKIPLKMSSITDMYSLLKDNNGRYASVTVSSLVPVLVDAGLMYKNVEEGRWILSDKGIGSEKSMKKWIGKAFCSIIDNKNPAKNSAIGESKILLIFWLWENKKSLPESYIEVSKNSGISTSIHGSSSVKLGLKCLVDAGVLSKAHRKSNYVVVN